MTALALLSVGVLLTVLATPARGLWPCAFAMLAPVAYFAERRSARATFTFAYVYSVAMALLIVRWLIHALAVEYAVERWAAWAFTILLVCGYAVIPAANASIYAALRGRADLLSDKVRLILTIASESMG